jgi:hypothetical protein
MKRDFVDIIKLYEVTEKIIFVPAEISFAI